MFFGGCANLRIANETASVPDGHMRVQVINDTDITMCYNVRWINHNLPNVFGPTPVCGGGLEPGDDHSFDRDIESWKFVGTRFWEISWHACKIKVYDEDREEIQKRYRSYYGMEIPEDTAIIKMYHKHYEPVPR